MKEYIKCKGKDVNCIEVKLDYDLGGWQYSTYTEKPRGYYIHVQPMELVHYDNGLVSYKFGVYTGYYKLLAECKRKSKSAETKAKVLYEDAKKQLVERVVNEMNLTLEENKTNLS